MTTIDISENELPLLFVSMSLHPKAERRWERRGIRMSIRELADELRDAIREAGEARSANYRHYKASKARVLFDEIERRLVDSGVN